MPTFSTLQEANQYIQSTIIEQAEKFGYTAKVANHNNLTSEQTTPYFTFRRPEEVNTPYADFSYVVFTDSDLRPDKIPTKLLVTLCVGSMQFKNDAVWATRPFWRREFQTLITNNKCFIKSDFSNVTDKANCIPAVAYDVLPASSNYWPVIQAGVVVDIDDLEKDRQSACFQWLACYANLREWGGKTAAKARRGYLPAQMQQNVQAEVTALLNTDKYVVLQGAPGVGKTYTATGIAQNYYDHVVFTQFHAETTYTDFIGGLVPDTTNTALTFKNTEGILVKAINKALDKPNEKVLLIIDEINRANLANVLGPVFYLFENGANNRCKLDITGVGELDKLPDNLHVLATMNTADRSLAVVDFALRRRFVWYTIRPAAFNDDNFHSEAFNDMAMIFRRYASDSELNLQPGPSYFMNNGTSDSLKHNIKYGLLPLIKEYLNEGYLAGSEEAFTAYFKEHADALLFE